MPGTHLADSGTHLETANRVSGLVSPEVKEMWKEITAHDKKNWDKSKGRYYPAYSLERLIIADHQIMKAWDR